MRGSVISKCLTGLRPRRRGSITLGACIILCLTAYCNLIIIHELWNVTDTDIDTDLIGKSEINQIQIVSLIKSSSVIISLVVYFLL